MVHVHQCFQAVGHGTFFTGIIATAPGEPIFSWVYDCGSKRTTRLEAEISDIENWKFWPDEIDLFVLSHFDDDHVNGVERFLRTKRVRHLALPYMDTAQRLAVASSVAGDACSASTALFQLDTIEWLRSRDLSERVDSILLVRGGRHGQNAPFPDGEVQPLPFNPNENGIQREVGVPEDEDLQRHYSHGLEVRAGDPKILTWHHSVPTSAFGVPVEFMFFNAEQNDLFRDDGKGNHVTKRSRALIGVVQADVRAVMHQYRLSDLSKAPRRRWREALRKVYERHFGHSSQARNNISLCLLVRPRFTNVAHCGIFRKEGAGLISENMGVRRGRGGILFLGDLRVDRKVIGEMVMHFGASRWTSISGVQVPHHGSQHSWRVGNATEFSPDWFVQCVPDSSTRHPHELVVDDLVGFNVVHADYGTRVMLDYHFK